MTITTNFYSDLDMHDPPSYYGGLKSAQVMDFGTYERRLSDARTGDWSGAGGTLRLADTDGAIRQRLASAADRFWTEPLAIRMVSPVVRAALGTPGTVFVGPIVGGGPVAPMGFDLQLGDAISQILLNDRAQSPWRIIGEGFLDQLTVVSEQLDHETPEPIIYGKHIRQLGIDAPSPEGYLYTPTLLGTQTLTFGLCYCWMLCGHAVKDVPDLVTIDAAGVRTSVIADEGTQWLVPHHAGWTAEFVTDYVDYLSSAFGVDRRYTLIYGLVGSANPDACAAGTLTLAVAIEGIEDVGDGSGALITDRILQYKHWLINYVANSGPNSYQAGAWLANPEWTLFDVTVPIVDEASFDAASAIGILLLPPDGYIGAAILGTDAGDRQGVTAWISAWNRSCDVRFGITRLGEMRVVMNNPTDAIRDAAATYTDAYEILQGSFGTEIRWTDQANQIPFRADRNHATGNWETVDVVTNDTLVTQYNKLIRGETREYRFAPGITASTHVALRDLARSSHPPRVITCEGTVGPLAMVELGDYIRYVHYAGVNATVRQVRLAQVQAIAISPGKRTVRVEALDVEDLIGY